MNTKPIVTERSMAAHIPAVASWTLTGLLTFLIAARAYLILNHYSFDPNEGWNAFQASRAISGAMLYPDKNSLIGNNYPPLSFYVIGLISKYSGDAIITGRIVAFISMIVAGAYVIGITWKLTRSGTRAPIVAGTLFFGLCATLLRRYVALDDPQWLATAMMLAGFSTILPSAPQRMPTTAQSITSAFLLLIGGFIKHNMLAMPISIGLWLFLYHKTSFKYWLITSLICLIAGIVTTVYFYSFSFIADVFLSGRQSSILRSVYKSLVPMLLMALPIAISTRLCAQAKGDQRIVLIALFIAIAIPIGLIERAGEGVDVNAHVETVIGLSITAAVSIQNVRSHRCSQFIVGALYAPLIVAGFIMAPRAIRELRENKEDERVWRITENRIAGQAGNAACEMPALCYWAGKKFSLDFFLYGQRALIDHNDSLLHRSIKENRIGIVELEPRNLRSSIGERPNPIYDDVRRHFKLLQTDEYGRSLFVPISTADGAGHSRR